MDENVTGTADNMKGNLSGVTRLKLKACSNVGNNDDRAADGGDMDTESVEKCARSRSIPEQSNEDDDMICQIKERFKKAPQMSKNIYFQIHKLHKANIETSLPFYELILHPDYSILVENVYHITILANLNLIRIRPGSDGHPHVWPTNVAEFRSKEGTREAHQSICSLIDEIHRKHQNLSKT